MSELVVSINSHFFKIDQITPRARPAVTSFAKLFVQYGYVRLPHIRKPIYRPIKVYGASTEDRTEYRFHINSLNKFKEHINFYGLTDSLVEFKQLPIPTPVPIDLKIKDGWVPREHQVPAIDYLTEDILPLRKFLNLRTGKGKSFCLMQAIANLKVRALLIIKPSFFEKWVIDLKKTCVLEDGDVVTVSGGEQLMSLIELGETNELTAKVILLSNKTYQIWISLYEKFGEGIKDLGYSCNPDELCEKIGAGIRAIDEVHLDFHLWFKIDCYTNVERSITLSATLISDDAFVSNMQEIMHPPLHRYQLATYVPYIASTAVFFSLKYPHKVRTKENGSKMYSHHAFEKSILRDTAMTDNYMKLIEKVVEGTYIKNYKPGQKCLIFCISINMCTVVMEYFASKYPDKKVSRYVEKDPYENLMTADICASTMQSAGTNVDIPDVSTVIQTMAMKSSPGNIQGMGRLRELKDGSTPEYLYFVCEDIKKNLEYHERKMVILRKEAKSHRIIYMGDRV